MSCSVRQCHSEDLTSQNRQVKSSLSPISLAGSEEQAHDATMISLYEHTTPAPGRISVEQSQPSYHEHHPALSMSLAFILSAGPQLGVTSCAEPSAVGATRFLLASATKSQAQSAISRGQTGVSKAVAHTKTEGQGVQVEQAKVLVRDNLMDGPHSISFSSRGEFGSILSQFI